MKVLDLFSGIGGFSLGLEAAGMETVAFCEIEDYPVTILNKHWPDVPVYRDVRKLTGEQIEQEVGRVNVICGGFPCQPFSVAGQQKGKEDDRHLWPEMFRLIQEIRPRWVIGENVAGFVRMALDDVLHDLEGEGYTTQSFVIPACAVGGIHRRDRVWIVAHSECHGRDETQKPGSTAKSEKESRVQQSKGCHSTSTGVSRDDASDSFLEQGIVAHTEHNGLPTEPWLRSDEETSAERGKEKQESTREFEREGGPFDVSGLRRSEGRKQRYNIAGIMGERGVSKDVSNLNSKGSQQQQQFRPIELPTQPPVRHRDDGLPDNVARLKALGNAVVPQIPELIGRAIMEVEEREKE